MKGMKRPNWLMEYGAQKLESILRGGSHALDNLRDFAGAVDVGTDHFIHLGRIHPHPVGLGRRSSRN
jgi:hypothetical protein